MNRGIAHLLACLPVALLLCLGLATSGAHAQGMSSLKDKMFGKRVEDGRAHAAPKVAHYISEDGQSFVFDESQGFPFLRFDGDDEVWVLTPTPGTKGDIIYKNDVGEQMLKATRWGGMVLFSDDRPMGDPVAVTGKAEAFQPDAMTPTLLWLSMVRASKRASQAADHQIVFDGHDASAESASLFFTASEATSDAIVHVALQSRTGRQSLAGLREVHFVEGRPPSAHMDKGILTLKLDVSRGAWAGHVSSKRVVNVLTASFSIADRH
jgi:hypothetical protein